MSESAVTSTLPALVTVFDFSMNASTVLPIVLSVSDTAPARAISPPEIEIVGSLALIDESSSAFTAVPFAALVRLPSILAVVAVVVVFVARAPAPLPATMLPTATATVTAEASIVERSCAFTRTTPERACTPLLASKISPLPLSASVIAAKTVLPISLLASIAAMATATPMGAKLKATDTAAASALISDASVASSTTLSAAMPRSFVTPSMNASTAVAILFSTWMPAPLPVMPTRPPDSATDTATTTALTVWSAVAVKLRSPVAAMLESRVQARTSAGVLGPPGV